MHLNQKLRMSRTPYAICFFKEGVFGRVYDMSLYLATLNLPLTIRISLVSSPSQPEQISLKGGVPLNWLLKHYQNQLIKYNWGYKLKGDWHVDLANYKHWQHEIQKQLLPTQMLSQHKLVL